MAGFWHFLPEASEADLVRGGRLQLTYLRRWGLQEVLADCLEVPDSLVVITCNRGPSQTGGVLLYPQHRPVELPACLTYEPPRQIWKRAQTGEAIRWIGWDREAPPAPETLRRDQQVDGYFVPDPAGRRWVVPIVRGKDKPYGNLPTDFQWSGSWEPKAVLKTRFEKLWGDSAAIWDHIYTEGKTEPLPRVAEFVARALAVNYRVGPAELDALRQAGLPVFDSDQINTFAALAVDVIAVREYAEQKKTV